MSACYFFIISYGVVGAFFLALKSLSCFRNILNILNNEIKHKNFSMVAYEIAKIYTLKLFSTRLEP